MNDDDWDFFNKSVGKLEKEVITLKKENERLKENIHSMLFTDDVVQDRYDKTKAENEKLKKQLEIAVNALKEYGNITNWHNEYSWNTSSMIPLFHLIKWRSSYGYELAVNSLEQIEELDK